MSYSACPYCLTKIETEEPSRVEEKKETKPEQPRLVQQTSSETPKCPQDFGYLSRRPRGTEIPEECMICEKIMECILYKINKGARAT
jgi:hypothetical protein